MEEESDSEALQRGKTADRKRGGKSVFSGVTETATPPHSVVFADIPGLVKGGLISAKGVGDGWVSFEYELEGLRGTGIATGSLSSAGELVLNLKLRGWHVLHFCHTPGLCVWLDGEKGCRELPGPQQRSSLRDHPIHAADLTGRRLHVAPVRGGESREAMLFYIRAVPCHGPYRGHRNLVATEDARDLYGGRMHDLEDIRRWFYPYRDSDFFRVLCGVECLQPPAGGRHGVWYAREKAFQDCIRRVAKQGDIHRMVVESAREVGLELHFYVRVGAFYWPFPRESNSKPFFLQNPQLRCRDEYGQEVKRLSYAFRETQDYLLESYGRILDSNPDGLCLAFNRGLPLMICEEPVCEEFERRHGRRPRLPQECDSEEMLAVRHDLMADFVERVRRLVDDRGKVLSCIVPRNFRENRLRGLNLPQLLRRGLLESVMVGGGHEDTLEYTRKTEQPPVDYDNLRPVRQLKSIGTARIYLGGDMRTGSFCPSVDPWKRVLRMKTILEAGLDGGFFWDAANWWEQDWEIIRRYGDRRFLQGIADHGLPAVRFRNTLSLNGMANDRYSAWNAY